MTIMPNLTFTSTDPTTGESVTHDVNPEELVAVTLPFQPAVINPRLVRRLSAKDWRHTETGWYEEEHRFLTNLGARNPNFLHIIDELRILLYAVFVKEAEVRGASKRHKRSRLHFVKAYNKFCSKWQKQPTLPLTTPAIQLAQTPDDYLSFVNTWSYWQTRNELFRVANVEVHPPT